MATIREMLTEKYGKRLSCRPNKPLWEKPSQDIYDGTTKPDLWCQVLGITDPATAKALLVTAINNAAATLGAGDLKTKMTDFNASMTQQELETLMAWAAARRIPYGEPPPTKEQMIASSALYEAAAFLRNETPGTMGMVVRRLIRYYVLHNGTTKEAEIASFYTFLRGEVDFNTWKGSYT
jgi:hypothetical protein